MSLNSRPIADFHPCKWGDHFLKISHENHGEIEEELKTLKESARKELEAKAGQPLEELEFIVHIQRLGLAYHFEEEIQKALSLMAEGYEDLCHKFDLSHVSLLFFTLKRHGFPVSSDVFKKFQNENGSFKESLIEDISGLLNLYEASYVRIHGDQILEEALKFTKTHLEATAGSLGSPLADQVAHALDQPLHRGVPRLESRHYISFYEKDPSHNKSLLRFAKLDFNLLQALHKKELHDLARWWKNLHSKVPFSRDRSAEAYFWMLGTYYEPKYWKGRKIFGKLFKITSLIDDLYDAFGTIHELQLLTHAIQRWNDGCMDQLPDHVKWCYQALLEIFSEIELELGEGRSFGVQYVKQQMKDLCSGYMQEAKWCHEKQIPTYEEYIKNGIITSAFPFGIVASFLGMGEIAREDAFKWACQNPQPKPVRAAAIINRLLNDVGGHKFEQRRNHVASSVQCHKTHHGVPSEEHAHDILKDIVEEAWKELNEAMLSPFAIPRLLLERILNMARVSGAIYNGEDGYTIVSQAMKQRVASVLVDPIPI